METWSCAEEIAPRKELGGSIELGELQQSKGDKRPVIVCKMISQLLQTLCQLHKTAEAC